MRAAVDARGAPSADIIENVPVAGQSAATGRSVSEFIWVGGEAMPQISRLGHVGLFCQDLMTMRRFYSQVMGLTITDEDLDRGIVFLSADPEAEHHELALARAKDPAQKTRNVQQISFKVHSLDDVRAFYHRLQQEGLRIDRTVTHGIACSVYFYDPEDNRIELYYTTPYKVRQPLGEVIDLDKPDEELLAFAQSFEATLGPSLGAQQPVG
jgi:catechol 2,3-dioxygenase-like lactoylglutathione lyase family enzyme